MQGGWARDPHSPRLRGGNKTHPSWKLTHKNPPYQPALAFDRCIITIQMLQLEIPLYSCINLPPSLPYCLQSTTKNPIPNKSQIIFIIKTQLGTMAMQLHRGWTHPGHSRTKIKKDQLTQGH